MKWYIVMTRPTFDRPAGVHVANLPATHHSGQQITYPAQRRLIAKIAKQTGQTWRAVAHSAPLPTASYQIIEV